MKLGFVSAILPDLSLEEVLDFAGAEGFSCLELMCWPKGRAERRYAGITHVDVARFAKSDARGVRDLAASAGVAISGLGYYPNPLAPDRQEAKVYVEHLKRVIRAAEHLGLKQVNTFVGRDRTRSLQDNWPRFLSVLGEVGYRGPVCIEVEDRAYAGSLAMRKAALRQSATFLRNFLPCADRRLLALRGRSPAMTRSLG